MAISGLGTVSGSFATTAYADQAAGLQLISPTSIANSGGSASSSNGTTTFTGVTSISLNGVFTSTYQNYRILINNVHSTNTGVGMQARLRASGTDNATSNYYWQYIDAGGTLVGANRQNAVTSWEIGTTAQQDLCIFDLVNPGLGALKSGFSTSTFNTTNGLKWVAYSHAVAISTVTDGITIYPSSGSITGKIRVYGYKGA